MSAANHCGCGGPACTCGCCAGVEEITPLATANRPGQSSLSYRVGTHAAFLRSMQATLGLPALKVRASDDPTLAFLDAGATVADVLTFYQERIANEGYLRTATERRSVLELARLVGYRLRPGVAASVHLAYTIDPNVTEQMTIALGARVQSVPGVDEVSQTFETSEPLAARSRWNNLAPRKTQPQTWESVYTEAKLGTGRVYLKGVATNLKPGDPLLAVPPNDDDPELLRVMQVTPETALERTRVDFERWSVSTTTLRARRSSAMRSAAAAANQSGQWYGNLSALSRPPSRPLSHGSRLPRDLSSSFDNGNDAALQVLGAMQPSLRQSLPAAVAGFDAWRDEPALEVYALRLKAGLFGHNFPKRQRVKRGANDSSETEIIGEWPIISQGHVITGVALLEGFSATESAQTIYLDASYEGLVPGGWIVLDFSVVPVFKKEEVRLAPTPYKKGKPKDGRAYLITRASAVQAKTSRAEYGSSGDTTRIDLEKPWLDFRDSTGNDGTQAMLDREFQVIRASAVYTQAEKLELAEEPIEAPLCDGAAQDEPIELDGLYEGLEPGRFVVVAGERADLESTGKATSAERAGTGAGNAGADVVLAAELAMVSAVRHGLRKADAPVPGSGTRADSLPGDRIHTFVWLDRRLEYCYRRDQTTIHGNIVKATQGETREEVLGSGEGARELQSFVLKQPPLTWVAAATAAGAQSTLQIFVNDVRWHEYDSPFDLAPRTHGFVTATDDEARVRVTFGDGRHGARPPTGQQNIRARYRNGIGRGGNVRAGQITLLTTRPLGVREVVNPLRASGGADAEKRDQARKNAPLAVRALDRLVSARDYEDFARVFAGIGKAYGTELGANGRPLVHVSVAGIDDAPIDEASDLFINLRRALQDFGDPTLQVALAVRELLLLVVSAKLSLHPDYQWEPVTAAVRAALLAAFGFERRELGEDLCASQIVAVMQAVPGVAYVDLDAFGGLPEKKTEIVDGELVRRLLTPPEIAAAVAAIVSAGPQPRVRVNLAQVEGGLLRPAQIALLSPDVPATLILNPLEQAHAGG